MLMSPTRDLTALEAHAARAGTSFACAFSSSDEFETELITLRRAQGRYARRLPWAPLTIAVVASAIAGILSLTI
jgi:hypothetical protein